MLRKENKKLRIVRKTETRVMNMKKKKREKKDSI